MKANSDRRIYEITRGEMNAFILESIAAAAFAGFIAMVFLPAILRSVLPLPDFIWKGLAFAAPGFVLFPVLRLYARNTYGREISAAKFLSWVVAAGAVGGGISALLDRVG